jgi:ribosomal protein S18 acetylase RimI-like enzyme
VPLRAATADDRDAVTALGVLEEAVWYGEAEFNAEEVGEWIDEEGGVASGIVAVDDGGIVRGFASPGRHEALYVADPARTDALAAELLPWLLARGPVEELTAFAGDAARLAAFELHGLAPHRSSFSLLRPDSAGPLPAPAFSDGVEVVPYRLGDADEEVHRLVFVEAEWSAVTGHSDRSLDAWREVTGHCTSLFLARRDGRPIGWVAGRIMSSGRGYVDLLAVATSERRRGLGRALLLHAFADLRRSGARDLALGVQADNESALGLYRSVGLEVEREWRVFSSRRGRRSPRRR